MRPISFYSLSPNFLPIFCSQFGGVRRRCEPDRDHVPHAEFLRGKGRPLRVRPLEEGPRHRPQAEPTLHHGPHDRARGHQGATPVLEPLCFQVAGELHSVALGNFLRKMEDEKKVVVHVRGEEREKTC